MTSPTKLDGTVPFTLTRMGVLMSPRAGDPLEAEGVLNPAIARSLDGTPYLFPRMVGRGNYSRIGVARLELDDAGQPARAYRAGVALEPRRSWERGARHGGTEDPRITWIESLGHYVMTYVAFGPTGPRTALAVSDDLESWQRLGPLTFDYDDALDADLNLFPNKDVVFFPEIVQAPDGTPSYAALHRPMWDLSFVRPDEHVRPPSNVPDGRPSIWISYVPASLIATDLRQLARLRGHRLVASPVYDWERLKIGAGPVPHRIDEGWLVLHHGVSGTITGGTFDLQQDVRYSAGAIILSADDPSKVLRRTAQPLLQPESAGETSGAVANVVFPTAMDTFHGLTYVFYGMADSQIGYARLDRLG